MENSKKENFIHQYKSQIAHATLPRRLAEDYSISSIIKDTADKKVYLLKDQHNQSFILKCCSAMYANALQQEYDFLTHHTNMDCFPSAVTFSKNRMCAFCCVIISKVRYSENIPNIYTQGTRTSGILRMHCCLI